MAREKLQIEYQILQDAEETGGFWSARFETVLCVLLCGLNERLGIAEK